jgi:hypothetical protein
MSWSAPFLIPAARTDNFGSFIVVIDGDVVSKVVAESHMMPTVESVFAALELHKDLPQFIRVLIFGFFFLGHCLSFQQQMPVMISWNFLCALRSQPESAIE